MCDFCPTHHDPRTVELDLVLGRLRNSLLLGLDVRMTLGLLIWTLDSSMPHLK